MTGNQSTPIATEVYLPTTPPESSVRTRVALQGSAGYEPGLAFARAQYSSKLLSSSWSAKRASAADIV